MRPAPEARARVVPPRRGRAALLAAALPLAVLAAEAPGGAVRAQTMLYPDRLPDGFAYVRFVNTLAEPVTVEPVGFGEPVTLGTAGAARVSAYRVVEGVAGRRLDVETAVGAGRGRGAFAVDPGTFDTVLVGADGGLSRVVDQSEISQTRARLAFYNAAPGCAAAGLEVEPGGRAVFAGVPPSAMRGRSVNPAAGVRLRATCSASAVVPLDPGDLGAGGQYSVWLMAPGGKATAFTTVNAIAPYLR